MLDKTLEIIGSISGVLGAVLIASNTDATKYGFILFTISSAAFAWMGWRKGMYPFFTTQMIFQAINVIGIYRWFF
jgi:nicotinamide riboside transporter PnuC